MLGPTQDPLSHPRPSGNEHIAAGKGYVILGEIFVVFNKSRSERCRGADLLLQWRSATVHFWYSQVQVKLKSSLAGLTDKALGVIVPFPAGAALYDVSLDPDIIQLNRVFASPVIGWGGISRSHHSIQLSVRRAPSVPPHGLWPPP
eukprot:sb/3473879/